MTMTGECNVPQKTLPPVSCGGAMRSWERIEAAFEGRETDRVPIHHIGFSSRAASLVLGREAFVGGGIQQYREACALWEGPEAHAEFLSRSLEDALALAEATGQDLVRAEYWRSPQRPSRRIDAQTFLYGDPQGAHRVMRYFPENELYQCTRQHPARSLEYADLEGQLRRQEEAFQAGAEPGPQWELPRRAWARFKGERAVRCVGWWLQIPYDPERWLEAVLERPDLVERKLELDVACSVRDVRRAAELGLRHLFGGGDFATNQGPLYSPRVFRELMAPRLRRITEACRPLGVRLLFGTDGNVWPVAEELFGTSGLDGFYEIDALAGMDLHRLRDRFPRLTLFGNLSSRTLHHGSRAEVVAETRAALDAARELRGVVVGCSNQVMPETPPENLWAMLETIERER